MQSRTACPPAARPACPQGRDNVLDLDADSRLYGVRRRRLPCPSRQVVTGHADSPTTTAWTARSPDSHSDSRLDAMPLIRETIVVTIGLDGRPHLAPLGLIQHATQHGAMWTIAPFQPSATLANLLATPQATASHPADVRVFAGLLTGRRDWATVASDRVRPPRLADALSHWELEVAALHEDEVRPRFHCRVVHEAAHGSFPGYNRAAAAVIEGAILVSRLHRLSREKVDAEMAYLRIAVDKTAGIAEREAWGWLEEAVAAQRTL